MGALLLALLALPAGAAEPRVVVDPRLELRALARGLPAPAAASCPPIAEYRRLVAARYSGAATERIPDPPGRPEDGADLLSRVSASAALEEPALPQGGADAFGGRRELGRWLTGLRALAASSKFFEFHASSASAAVSPGLARLEAELGRLALVSDVERYSGLRLKGRVTIVAPALDPALDMPVRIETAPDGSRELYWTLGICPPADDARARTEAAGIAVSVWHEALHGVLDPLADLHAREVAALSKWDVREHIVQAATLRIAAARRTPAFDPAPNTRPGLDPVVMAALASALERREKTNPGTSLAAFYPELLAAFPRAGRAEPPEPRDPLLELIEAFPSEGARRAAVDRIGDSLKGGDDRELRLRRAALRWLDGDVRGALADARGEPLEAVVLADAGRPAPDCAGDGAWCREARWWAKPVAPEAPPARRQPAPAASTCASPLACRTEAVRRFGEGRPGDALAALDRGVSQDPDDVDLLLDRGTVLAAVGRAEDAKDSYEKVLAATAARRGPSRWVRAEALAAVGSLEAALREGGQDWRRRPDVELQLKRARRLKKASGR